MRHPRMGRQRSGVRRGLGGRAQAGVSQRPHRGAGSGSEIRRITRRSQRGAGVAARRKTHSDDMAHRAVGDLGQRLRVSVCGAVVGGADLAPQGLLPQHCAQMAGAQLRHPQLRYHGQHR